MSNPASERARRLHAQAMTLAHRASLLAPDEALAAFAEAFHAEEDALRAWIADTDGAEPTRSVLCRSAAALALWAGLLDASERLAFEVTSSPAPAWVIAEVQEILERVHLARDAQVWQDKSIRFALSYARAVAEQPEAVVAAAAPLYQPALDAQPDLEARTVAAVVAATFATADERADVPPMTVEQLEAAIAALPSKQDEFARRYAFAADVAEFEVN